MSTASSLGRSSSGIGTGWLRLGPILLDGETRSHQTGSVSTQWPSTSRRTGAHFSDDEDRARVEAKVALLEKDEWQLRKRRGKKGPIYVNDAGDTVSKVVDGACIFLNRAGHPGGPGCAFHSAALRRGESILDWKPEVCWQLPLRRHDEADTYGHVTSTLREWKRRDWGEGGAEFHWWCTESHDAFIDPQPVEGDDVERGRDVAAPAGLQ